ncbi:MAG: hypothetical protein HN909_01335 [Phycisphaerales bacterium]|jgi:hypothetical protein|nr:hypothetical protein [Phycisphaerales bacterium]MBT7170392.1 hypothetical protein [Phycisphaerales bacterium]
MIQCEQCEYFRRGANGQVQFACDPFSTIKEPECLQKWELLKMTQLVSSYQKTLAFYERLAPMQEKMFRMMESEMDDLDESNSWKQGSDEDYDDAGLDEADDDADDDDDNDEIYPDPDAWKQG